MFNFDIGLSGLKVAQTAIDLIGTNMANATTPGYHRQDMTVVAKDYSTLGGNANGGAEVSGITRAVDDLLEHEIGRQETTIAQTNEELGTLQSIEGALGDIGSNNLIASMGNFYSALKQLASQPDSNPLSQQVVSSGQAMATEFNNLSSFLAGIQTNVMQKANQQVDQINTLSGQIADLNGQIGTVVIRGGVANMLMDQRDQLIHQLSGLIGVRIDTADGRLGTVNVTAGGTPLVMGVDHNDLVLGKAPGGQLGYSVKGSEFVITNVAGGSLGGLVNLANATLPQVQGQLDTLAGQVASEMNQLHVQGVGVSGSFTVLTGEQRVANQPIDTWGLGVQAGQVYVRVTNTATGQTTRSAVNIDPATQTLQDVATAFNALPGISAGVVDSSLKIQADSGYTFDFLPQVDAGPTAQAITGSSRPAFDGSYQGTANDMLRFTVKGSGEVGLTDGLSIEVRNTAGDLLKTVDVGSGYASGDAIDLGNGVSLKMASGTLADGDRFSLLAPADTDTANFLSAAGINTFFTGSDSGHIAVRADVQADPSLVNCSSRSDFVNNDNILRMSQLADKQVAGLKGATPEEYLRQFVTSIGQQVSTRQAAQSSVQKIMDQLNSQRTDMSGVDLNEQAARLIVYQRMYQGLSRYISTQDQSLKSLMEIV